MSITERLSATPSITHDLRRRIALGWTSFGIRTKILVPLMLLMSLSLLGSTIGFIVSTNTTRNSILDDQLRADGERVIGTLHQSEEALRESARKMAADPQLQALLLEEQTRPGINNALAMDDRVFRVFDRFSLNQVMVFDAKEQTRVNIAPSHLEPFSFEVGNFIACDQSPNLQLITTTIDAIRSQDEVQLLVACFPIISNADAEVGHGSVAEEHLVGTVYTVLDMEIELEELKEELELRSEIRPVLEAISPLSAAAACVFPEGDEQPMSREGFRVQNVLVELAGTCAALTLRLDEQTINQTVNSGFRVMLFGSVLTLVVLIIGGYLLAQSFIRPILHLANVAQAVAGGDLSRRSHLTHNDEIGQLGRSINHATDTITHLLDQQARTAGELQAILQSMGDGVLAVDLEERIVMVNPSAAALLCQESATLIGRRLDTILTVDDPVLVTGLHQITDQVRRELTDPDLAVTEERVSLGSQIVRLQSAPTLGSGSTLTGAVVLLQDITRAVEANRAKSEFIATASHELRTPLSGLKGFVDVFLLSGTENLNESQRMFLDTIKRQTDNMVQMVNDLLEMARLEQGNIRTERRWVSLESSIEESLSSLTSLIQKRQVTMTVELAPSLPPIWIDSLHLRRILTNIISNAAKYVYQSGNVQVRAYELHDPSLLPSPPCDERWVYQEHRSVVVVVEDNGVGIRKSDQDKIFTRFFRSENPLSVEVGGTGLGLAVTRELINTNNGQIGFRSVEGQGSCFWVRLPAPSTEPLEDGGS